MKDLNTQHLELTAKRKEIHRLRSRLIISVLLLLIVTAVVLILIFI